MTDYYVNKNARESGDHEVHQRACGFLPSPECCIYLGDFTHCRQAVAEARNYYHRADGCYHCSTDCHRH